jgi:hypothetical protein
MAVAFKKGQVLTKDDLMIAVRNTSGDLVDPAIITYSLFDYTTGVEVLIGDPNRIPQSTNTGMFFVAEAIPLDANIGEWVVRWNMRQRATDPIVQVVQRFQVVGDQVVTAVTTEPSEAVLIRRLRFLLRDNNPDRNYRFRPPNSEKFIQSQTEVFGYLWEDEELLEYILMSVDSFNAAPPVTGITASDLPDRWRTVVVMGAAAHACRAMALNWAADEFSVSGDEQLWVRDASTSRQYLVTLADLHAAATDVYMEQVRATVREFQEEDGDTDTYEAVFPGGGLGNNPLHRALEHSRLEVLSVDRESGDVRWRRVSAVMRHDVLSKRAFRVGVAGHGEVVCTEDHSLFGVQDGKQLAPVAVSEVDKGSWVATVENGQVESSMVTCVEEVDPYTHMYDIAVPGDENFVLSSGIVAHNSYSISGVSLDIDKSSKYMSLKENFESEHEKMLEQAKTSIKIVKGLQQPRYGIGISSALGPFSRVGVQSRRNYVSGTGSWT